LELTESAKAAPSPLGVVRIRYKAPEPGDRAARGADAATERAFEMAAPPAASFEAAAPDLRFAFAVAAFADVLRGQDDARVWSLDAIEQVARATAGSDPDRNELVSLIDKARRLRGPSAAVAR
ncbi:MAG TPA: YfbK domain-containing protein, partial [Kofleriaceae bacterium]|nr:YfbK domain-containing protein [Kofleriaceae bacterium]